MQWIIKHVPGEQYVCSKRISVCNSEFARKFNSVRQARIFLRRSDFPKEECIVKEYDSDKHKRYTDPNEIAEYIRHNFFGEYSCLKTKDATGLAKK